MSCEFSMKVSKNVCRLFQVNIGSCNGLALSGHKPLYELRLTNIHVAVWRHNEELKANSNDNGYYAIAIPVRFYLWQRPMRLSHDIRTVVGDLPKEATPKKMAIVQ